MKALFLASIFMLLISCSTTDGSPDESYLDRGYRLSGEDAASVYLEGIENTPSAELYYNLAYSYLESRDYDKAIECARTASELYPDMIRFDYLILYAYRESGMMYSYEKELERLAGKYPANNTIAEMLLSCYKGARRVEAIPIARRLLSRSPSNQTAIAALGEFYDFYRAISQENAQTEAQPWDTGVKEIYNITNTINDRLLT